MRFLAAVLLGLTLCGSASAQDPLPADTLSLFESVRSAAIARRVEMVKDANSLSVRRLRAITPRRSTSAKAWAELTAHDDGTRTQWISTGLLDQLETRAQGRPHFAARVLTLILARQLVALWTVSPVDRAEDESVRVFNRVAGADGSPTEEEIRAAVELLTESRGLEIECRKAFLDMGPMKCKFVPRWKVTLRYGQVATQVRHYQQAVARVQPQGGLVAAVPQ